jgi:hypothetical protein
MEKGELNEINAKLEVKLAREETVLRSKQQNQM